MDSTILRNYHEAVRFGVERFSPVVVAQTERMKVVLTCFEPDPFIPVHSPEVDMALVIVEGNGLVMSGEAEERVGAGAMVVVPAGEARGVRAICRLVAVHVVSPPPSESDHAAVQTGLQQGVWRGRTARHRSGHRHARVRRSMIAPSIGDANEWTTLVARLVPFGARPTSHRGLLEPATPHSPRSRISTPSQRGSLCEKVHIQRVMMLTVAGLDAV